MLASPALRDVLPLILEYISEVGDLASVDLTCSYLHKINANSGWKTFGTETLALPLSYKGDDVTWKSFLCTRVRPMYERMSRIRPVAEHRKKIRVMVASNSKVYEKYQQQACISTARKVLSIHDWPVDIGIFISCHCCIFSRAPFLAEPDYENKLDSTDSFALWEEYGVNDTHYWTYVVLKGSVKVPLAPPKYFHNIIRGEPVEIGRGGIVTFSHWNHGGDNTTPHHVYPLWDPKEFGFDELAFKAPCDEWVRVNLEEPVGASMDSLPAAWQNIWEFMDEHYSSSPGSWSAENTGINSTVSNNEK